MLTSIEIFIMAFSACFGFCVSNSKFTTQNIMRIRGGYTPFLLSVSKVPIYGIL